MLPLYDCHSRESGNLFGLHLDSRVRGNDADRRPTRTLVVTWIPACAGMTYWAFKVGDVDKPGFPRARSLRVRSKISLALRRQTKDDRPLLSSVVRCLSSANVQTCLRLDPKAGRDGAEMVPSVHRAPFRTVLPLRNGVYSLSITGR